MAPGPKRPPTGGATPPAPTDGGGRRARRLSAAFLALLAAGCADPSRVGGEIAAGRRPGAYVPDIPGERQNDPASCGANALASLLRRWGIPADQRALHAVLHVPSIRGALTVDLWREARARGLSAWETRNLSEDDLRAALAAGVPPVVLLRLPSLRGPLDHFAILTGHDGAGRRWIVRMGSGRETFLAEAAFTRAWSGGGRWTLLAAPPGTEAACRAWALAAPDDWRPWNNLADRLAREGRLGAAEAALREALARAPAPAEDGAGAWLYLSDTRGLLRQAQGDADGAAADFAAALAAAEAAGADPAARAAIRAHLDAARRARDLTGAAE